MSGEESGDLFIHLLKPFCFATHLKESRSCISVFFLQHKVIHKHPEKHHFWGCHVLKNTKILVKIPGFKGKGEEKTGYKKMVSENAFLRCSSPPASFLKKRMTERGKRATSGHQGMPLEANGCLWVPNWLLLKRLDVIKTCKYNSRSLRLHRSHV